MSSLDRIVGSKLNYWFSFVVDSSTAVFFLLRGVFAYTGNRVSCTVALALGALSWGLLEYSCHRWFFHLPGSLAHQGHMRHHDEPDGLLAMPWFATTIVAFALWFVLRGVIPDGPAAFSMTALMTGYISYGTLHHMYHHVNINVLPGQLLKRSWANHQIHHKRPTTNYGVTTTFWDRVFGTHYPSRAHASTSPRGRSVCTGYGTTQRPPRAMHVPCR